MIDGFLRTLATIIFLRALTVFILIERGSHRIFIFLEGSTKTRIRTLGHGMKQTNKNDGSSLFTPPWALQLASRLSCAACDCLRGLWAHKLIFYPLLPLSLGLAAVCWRQHPEIHRSPFPARRPHVTKHCSSLSHILHNKFLFCRVLSHMVLGDFSAKQRIIFQFRWVAWFYVVLRLLGKRSQLLIYLSDEEKVTWMIITCF